MELKIVQRDDNISQVALIGRLDVTGLHDVDVRFHGATAARGNNTIVDLSQLEIITSLGIGMIIACARSLHAKGKRMVLAAAQPVVDKTLRTVGVDQVLDLVPTLADAEQALK